MDAEYDYIGTVVALHEILSPTVPEYIQTLDSIRQRLAGN
jgi:hypothetical protein